MSHRVNWPISLERLNPWYPGQMGVPGTDSRTGLRTTCEGAVFYVDPNYPGVSDLRDGTNPTDPLATVGAALSKCQPFRGDTIAVMPNNAWQYGRPADGRVLGIAEEVIVTVPGIRIAGIAPSGALGVQWSPISGTGTCITVRALDVLIEGFIFTSGIQAQVARAIFAQWIAATYYGDNLVVRNCFFDGDVQIAIQLQYAWFCHIYQNIFQGVDVCAIYSDPAHLALDHNFIYDNLFMLSSPAKACALRKMTYSHIYGNSFYNDDAQAGAASTDEGIDTTGGGYNMVFNNWFSCLMPHAGAGDWDDFNTAAATDAWVENHLLNGLAITNPT